MSGDSYVPLRLRRLAKLARATELAEEARIKSALELQNLQPVQPQEPIQAERIKPATPDAEPLALTQVRLTTGQTVADEVAMIKAEESRLLAQVQRSLSTPLMSVKERAQGVSYDQPITTDWTLPAAYQKLSEHQVNKIRKKLRVEAQGENVPPPITKFSRMQLPKAILRVLEKMDIRDPTAIQAQGLPCALLGRDIIGLAFTGSGKTLVFLIPLILRALEAELRLPLLPREGPIGLVICPSRELAVQTQTSAENFARELERDHFPRLRSLVVIGGMASSEQSRALQRGVHMVVATPGRLNDLLSRGKMHLAQCGYLTLDEADRLVDLGFEEEIRSVLDHFTHQRQTLFFSATMPRKVREFASSALVSPIYVSVGRAGTANLSVTQVIEYVKEEGKLAFLLDCLNRTPPPVVIFCENKTDVDDVFEYLLIKDIDAVALHGGLSQQERSDAITRFRSGDRDVLIATDVASKGLDFPNIQHVINYDMPREIENYVHRIGRTGRCGRSGMATTMVNRLTDELTLSDLKALLLEAKQKVPFFLNHMVAQQSMDAQKEIGGVRGCAYCGGLGHRISACPKLTALRSRQLGQKKDVLATGTRYGHTAAYEGNW